MTISAPAPHPEPNPAPAADPAPKPGLAPLVYTQPVAVSYNAFSSVQTHPSASLALVKSAPAVVPAVSALPTVYTLQAQAAPAVGEYYFFFVQMKSCHSDEQEFTLGMSKNFKLKKILYL